MFIKRQPCDIWAHKKLQPPSYMSNICVHTIHNTESFCIYLSIYLSIIEYKMHMFIGAEWGIYLDI